MASVRKYSRLPAIVVGGGLIAIALVSWFTPLRYLGAGTFATVEYLLGVNEAEPYYYQSLGYFLTGASVCYASYRTRTLLLGVLSGTGVVFLLGELRFGVQLLSLAGLGAVLTGTVGLLALLSRSDGHSSSLPSRLARLIDTDVREPERLAGYSACVVVCVVLGAYTAVGDPFAGTAEPVPAFLYLTGKESVYAEAQGSFRTAIALGSFAAFVADTTRQGATRWLALTAVVLNLSAISVLWFWNARGLAAAIVGVLVTVAAVGAATRGETEREAASP
ncbi:hypothetical protein [Halobaculum sp. MBLA0143]|uniref:hypothetical protein n=1 Tax=Halobaculum sp. MBLA0143 TaxID=3079933 RepID=UPI0035264A7B